MTDRHAHMHIILLDTIASCKIRYKQRYDRPAAPIFSQNSRYTDSHAKSEGRKVRRKILVLRAVLRPSALRHNKRSTQKRTEGRLRRNRRTKAFACVTKDRALLLNRLYSSVDAQVSENNVLISTGVITVLYKKRWRVCDTVLGAVLIFITKLAKHSIFRESVFIYRAKPWRPLIIEASLGLALACGLLVTSCGQIKPARRAYL